MKKSIVWMTMAVFLGLMLFSMANNAQGVLLSSFIDAFGLESTRQGWPNAAANVGVIVAMLLAVSIAARVGMRWLFTAGLGTIALMLALAGAAQSSAWLILTYLVMGFAFGCVDTTASSIVADLHQGPRANLLMGMLHAAYGAGGILAPVLMTAALTSGAVWRAVLWMLSGVVLLACAFSAVIVNKTKGRLPPSANPPKKLSVADLRLFAKRPGNLLMVCSVACYCAHQCSIYLWISRIIEVHYGNIALGATALY